MRKDDFISGGVLFCVALGILLNVKGSALTRKGAAFGPDFFPLVVGVLLGLLSILLMVHSVSFPKSSIHRASQNGKTTTLPKRIFLTAVCYSAFAYLIGFLISTLGFVFIGTRLMGERNYVRNIMYSLGFGFLMHFVFISLLDLPLPRGVLWRFLGI